MTNFVTKNILTVDPPEHLSVSIKSGLEFWDHVTGGFIPSVVSMFSGSPGAGKTTMCAQVADALSKSDDNIVFYNSSEQTIDQIAHLCKKRLKLEHGFLFESFKTWEEIKCYCLNLTLKYPNKNKIVMIDSLSKLAGTKRSRAQEIAESFIELCQSTNIAGLMIVHLTKQGNFAGNNGMLHDFDSYFHLMSYNEDMEDDSEDDDGLRVLESRKNRFGKLRQAFTVLSDNGHTYGDEDDKSGDGDLKADGSNDSFLNFL